MRADEDGAVGREAVASKALSKRLRARWVEFETVALRGSGR